MKRIFEIFFRKREDVFLLIGLLAAMIVFFQFSLFRYKINLEDRSYDYYRYVSIINVSYQGVSRNNEKKEAFGELVDYLCQIKHANISCEISVHRNDRIETQRAVVMLARNESVSFLEDMESQSKVTDNGVYIGKSFYDDKEVDKEVQEYGRFSLGGGFFLPVAGTIKNRMAGGYDDSVYILWDQCDKNVQRELLRIMKEQSNLYVIFESQDDFTKEYRDLEDKLKEWSLSSSTRSAKQNMLVESRWYRLFNGIFQSAAVAFAIMSCISVFYYWVNSMGANVAVRMACGYSTYQIIQFLIQRILTVSSFAFLGFLLFEIFQKVDWNDQDISLIKGMGEVSVYMLLFFLLLFAISLYLIVKQVKRYSLSEMLRDE